MLSRASFIKGAALAALAPLTPALATADTPEPPQVDDFVNVADQPYTFYVSQDVLPHRTCLVYNGTTIRVGKREGRRIDDVIPAGPSVCWMLVGTLRTDSEGTHYVRANALVNGQPCEVADYGGYNIFECTNGYQVAPTTPGCFCYDPAYPGEPWVAYMTWNLGKMAQDW